MTITMTEHALNQLSLRELQSRFREVVGEETRCPNKTFLVRRILSALAGQASSNDAGSALSNQESETSASEQPAQERSAPEPIASAHAPEDQLHVDAAVAAPPAAEPPSAEPLAEEPPAIVAALAVQEEHLAPADASTESGLHGAPVEEQPTPSDAPQAPEDEAPTTVIDPAPITEAIPPRLALAEDEAPLHDKRPLDASASGAENVLASDAVENHSASAVEDAPANEAIANVSASEADDATASLLPSASVPAASLSSTSPARGRRGRFRDMSVEQLQALYLATVGRSTGSSDRHYLEWKIREAEKGHIPVGPREQRAAESEASGDIRVLPLRLDGAAVDALDATWKSHGMKSRMDFFRRALGHYLAHLGANGAAMHFTSQPAE